ncbi:4-coumarate--CoA ligase [Coemansia asiatica]|uniref:4-coumarate--CoA ligase n=1 Tax=Coemansia asiatica TaxID=1052880 RepID=A0A9W8CM83_9FUNG|nr:4-coumarate--CoA ligase [Coemansia asiatica]
MIFESILPPTDIPGYDIPTFFMNTSRMNLEQPDTPAYYDLATGKNISFSQLYLLYKQVASGLINNLDIEPGDVVAVFSSNSIYYAPAFFGIIAAGAVCCTVSSMFKEGELQYQMEDSKAKVLFVGSKQAHIARAAMEQGLLKIAAEKIVILDDQDYWGFKSFGKILSDQSFEPLLFNNPERSAKTLAVIVYSSGTTGFPKGVMLSHRNIVAYTVLSATMFAFVQSKDGVEEKTQRSLAMLPFAHIYRLTSLVTNSVAGAKTQYILNDFSIEKFLHYLEKHRIETASVVPTVLNQLVRFRDISKYDLSALKVLGSGGAALPDGTHGDVRRKFPVSTGNGYGMSETCSGVCLMSNFEFIAGSVGFLFPGMQAKIIDPETGRALGPEQQGELCLRGPTIMMGYLGRPEETAKTIDAEGFLHTGDMAYIKKTGHVFITERIKELIKYKGLQVPPAELESILMKHDGVVDAAVIGVHDKVRGTEAPRAFVVTAGAADKGESEQLAGELIAWVSSRVADHKKLRGGIEFVDAIPRNPSGKILHRQLRLQYNAKHGTKL